MTEHIGAAPYERNASRTGHRNGHKPRTLRTRVGTLNLLVPQDREGTFSTRLFARYQRNEKALCLALMEMYVEGVSTRKVKEVTEELCGTSFSKSLVSSLAGSPRRGARSVEESPAGGGGLPLPVRGRPLREGEGGRAGGEPGRPGRLGGTRDGRLPGDPRRGGRRHRERGDLPRAVPLAEGARALEASSWWSPTSTQGLKAAIARHFQGASHQRCQVHYARNLLGMVGHAKRKELGEDLRGDLRRPAREQAALKLASSVAEKWRQKGIREGLRAPRRARRGVPFAAWPSPSPTEGASAPPTAWRGSTRR